MVRHETFAEPHRAMLTVDDFLALCERGAFDDYARAELIDGEIWVVNATYSRHARAHATLTGELFAALKTLGTPLVLYSTPAVELSEDSLPEPDIVVTDPVERRIVAGPTVRLAIEIADSTLDMDLSRKLRLYARHAVPEYWVVDVAARVIHQLWAPAGDAYGERRELAFGAPLAAATIAGLVVETAGLG